MIRNSLFIIFILLFFPLSTLGAVLYFEPAEGNYYQGDTFIIQARINTEGECINTIEGNLSFSQDVLEAIDFSQGDSILPIWINPPSINQESGRISFAGGIPGGYCGRLPGDPGESNLLGKIIFKVKAVGEQGGEQFIANLEFLDTSQVLLNDGLGTIAELSTKGAVLTILPGTGGTLKQEWQEELTGDETPPEVFKIEISQDPSTFKGKYFITFFTTDKQTGIDYYEVKEGERDWQKTVSPYLLQDQGLRSIIKVRAVDKAGNFLVIEQLPTKKPLPYQYFVIVLILIAGGISWFIIRKIRHKP